MAKLDTEIQIQLDSLVGEASERNKAGNYQEALGSLLQCWDLLPEPKEKYDESYHIVKYIATLALMHKDINTAGDWIEKIYDCDRERIDSGEREYIHGRIALASNNVDKAKSLFRVAYEKSDKRYPTEKEFRKLLKE